MPLVHRRSEGWRGSSASAVRHGRDRSCGRSTLRLLALLSTGLAVGQATAAPLAPEVAEVRDCAERNLPQHSARQEIVLERSVQGRKARRLEATLLWKRAEDGLSRVRVTVNAPPPERGTAFLLIEREGPDDMFSYLPEYRKVRRITTRAVTGSFLGTDVSYEDFQRLQGLADRSEVKRLEDATLAGRPVYVLEAASRSDPASAYDRVRSYFDRETCVLLRAELSGPGVEREVEVAWADVERVDERWIPRRLVLRDRTKGSETRLSVSNAEWDVDLPDRLFRESALAQGH
jgi:outer membrane lipoprotein-sorting protein